MLKWALCNVYVYFTLNGRCQIRCTSTSTTFWKRSTLNCLLVHYLIAQSSGPYIQIRSSQWALRSIALDFVKQWTAGIIPRSGLGLVVLLRCTGWSQTDVEISTQDGEGEGGFGFCAPRPITCSFIISMKCFEEKKDLLYILSVKPE